MTVEQIQVGADEIRLYLGRVPIHLPEPVATLARTVVANRQGHATIGALTPSPWLFPGGQPGRLGHLRRRRQPPQQHREDRR
jgi:hypothetical protein